MGRMRELDDRIDQLGYLRLNTPQPVTRLIGNVINPEMAQLAREDGIETNAKAVKETGGLVKRVFKLRAVNGVARRIYNWLFKVINS